MFKNLAIKGGGVRGIAYVGAIQEMDNAGLLSPIERVAGTSAGALMACMICAGYNVGEIKKLMLSIEFKKFNRGWNPLRILTGYGLFSGRYILEFTKNLLNSSPNKLKADCTFLDMRNAGCKDLYVFACNTSLQTITEFSADKTPRAPVAEAVRASMSIPFYFKAWQFSNKEIDPHIYVDGGVVYNYPLSFFDNDRFNDMPQINDESVGLFLYTKSSANKKLIRFNHPVFFTRQVFESLLATQDFITLEDKEQMQRSILIDDLNIPPTDFKISPDQCTKLIDAGAKATQQFIKNTIQKENSL